VLFRSYNVLGKKVGEIFQEQIVSDNAEYYFVITLKKLTINRSNALDIADFLNQLNHNKEKRKNGGKKEKKANSNDPSSKERYIIDVPISFIQHCYNNAQTNERKEELGKLLEKEMKQILNDCIFNIDSHQATRKRICILFNHLRYKDWNQCFCGEKKYED